MRETSTNDESWSTAALAPSQQVEFWREITRRSFAPLQMVPAKLSRFAAEGRIGWRGRLRLSRVVTDPHAAQQTRRSLTEGPGEGFSLKYVGGRSLIAEQRGERVRLGPGDIALIDLTAPCTLEFPDGADLYALYLPSAVLAPRFGPRRRPPSLRLPHSGVTSLIGGMLRSLWMLGEDELGELDWGLLDYLGSLIARAFREQSVSPGRQIRIDHVLHEIEAGLGDHSLSAAAVAHRLGISRSHLYALLAAAGTSFAGELRKRRLTAAARLLAGTEDKPGRVADIAMRCGYLDAASFSRAFRRHFGHPPSALRRKT